MNDTLTATANRIDAITVRDRGVYDGVRWFRTYPGSLCYGVYVSLPPVVSYEGRRYIKMGWNTDTGSVSYKESDAIAIATRSN